MKLLDATYLNGARVLRFLRRPTLDGLEHADRPIVEAICLFVLLGVALVVLGALLMPLWLLVEVTPSQKIEDAMTAPLAPLVLSVVFLGPLVEEVLFRSWLSGERRMLLAAALFIALYVGGPQLLAIAGWTVTASARFGFLAAAGIAFAGVMAALPRTAPLAAYADAFPLIFWANALLFGVLHIANYAGSAGVLLALFTLPQLIAGLIFGYARIRIGLWAAIGLHMAFNALPVLGTLAARLL
jgi:membrane protease YdiL (CAAX protease family)